VALEVAGSKPVTRPISPERRWGNRFFALSETAGEEAVCGHAEMFAGVAELVDALVLGTSGESRGGSSPSARTIGVKLV
jgi:hypothetical protein